MQKKKKKPKQFKKQEYSRTNRKIIKTIINRVRWTNIRFWFENRDNSLKILG